MVNIIILTSIRNLQVYLYSAIKNTYFWNLSDTTCMKRTCGVVFKIMQVINRKELLLPVLKVQKEMNLVVLVAKSQIVAICAYSLGFHPN